MSQSFTDFHVVLANQTEPITFYVRDTLTNSLTDVAGTSSFNLINISDDSSEDSGSFTASGGTSITHAGTGIYQYSFDASTYNEEYLLATRCILENVTVSNNVFVKSVSTKYYAYAAQLRVQVDKARKSISDYIENMDRASTDPDIQLFYGYDDKHLIFYLDRGVQFINAIPPYTSLTVDNYPFAQYGTILIDAATIAALESQGIFSIDTDFNYALGGNSLVIDHYGKLSGMISAILNRFTKASVGFKQQYRTKGTVLHQVGPGGYMGAGRIYSALPAGFWSRFFSSARSD